MTHTHLTDDQLISTCLAGSVPVDQHDEHAVTCPSCQQRRAALAGLLDEVSTSATAAAEAAFPPERLARQHARILQRLDQLRLDQHRAGRVIAFPLGHAHRTSQLHARPVRRWIAGAAAAGLLIGMVAGHLVHELPVIGDRSTEQHAVSQQASVPLRAPSGPMSDDEFMREIEAAIGSSGPAALRRIDDVTPVAWEVR